LRKTHGFTLIEMIFVILIIGVLAVLPIYNWPGTDINLDAQAKLLANDLRYTQSLAMSKSERYSLVGISSTAYQIQNSAGTPITLPSGSTTETFNAGLTISGQANLPDGLVSFDGKGTPYLDTTVPGSPLVAGTTYTISITGGGLTKSVGISPITGRVYLP
jgi:prepilin-type N-terminal cleavage/methylation domain-containing protein